MPSETPRQLCHSRRLAPSLLAIGLMLSSGCSCNRQPEAPETTKVEAEIEPVAEEPKTPPDETPDDASSTEAASAARAASAAPAAGDAGGSGEAEGSSGARLSAAAARLVATQRSEQARSSAAAGEHGEAFEHALAAWQAVRVHPQDAACQQLTAELAEQLEQYGERAGEAPSTRYSPKSIIVR